MNDKILPDDNKTESIDELTNQLNEIIELLEKEKNLENSIQKYQELIRLNNLIEKKFQKNSKKISEKTKQKIKDLNLNKNGKWIFENCERY